MGSREALHDREYRRFVKRLREARESAGLTQQAVAKAMGRSQRFVSRCETGERRVDVIEFRDFLRVYGLRPSDLVTGFPSE
ncbi:MAG: helix-turn-helix domain-containing protein [Planctomycetota bacterium]